MRLIPEGTVLLTSRAPIGKVAIAGSDMYCNQGFKNILCSDAINNKYLFWFLKGKNEYLNSLGRGATFKEISKAIVENISLSLPPIDVQIHIAHKLDAVFELLSLRKKQLVELEQLIKSVFYEMFGDPIANNKGWEQKRLIDVVKFQRGYDLPVNQRIDTGNVEVYGSNGILGYHSEAKARSGIIIGRSGTIGKVYCTFNEFWPLNTTLYSINTYDNNLIYLKYLLTYFDLSRFSSGTGVPTLNRNIIHPEKIIFVPIHLQNRFAEIVSQIETQKSLIKQSIDDTQRLFDSLMSKYFDD
jgi:type I restriction enzyme S subunit